MKQTLEHLHHRHWPVLYTQS